jgi:hypothetical protein
LHAAIVSDLSGSHRQLGACATVACGVPPRGLPQWRMTTTLRTFWLPARHAALGRSILRAAR